MAARRPAGPCALAALMLGFLACGGGQAAPGTRDAAADATGGNATGGDAMVMDDPAPSFTADERTALATLRYDMSAPPLDPSNQVADNAQARALGQRLFFETAFSGRLLEGDNDGTVGTLGAQGDAGKVSCASCHVPETGFVDTRSPHRQVSLAAQWTLRRSPTLLEIGFAPLLNWDGRRDALWNQALGVVENNREFNSSRLFLAEQIFRLYKAPYEALFGALPPLDDAARFPQLTAETTGCVEVNTPQGSRFNCRGLPGDTSAYDGLSADDQALVTRVAVNATKALAAYERQLRCGAGRFDAWLDGDGSALSRAEQRGAALFAGKGGCINCHSGPRLTDGQFHNVGLSPAPVAVAIEDRDDRGAAVGLADALKDPLSSAGVFSDGNRHALPAALPANAEGAFRTPTLRCIANQPSFMHTAQMNRLEQVMAFFNRGGDPAGHYPGKNELRALGLSERERSDLVAFMTTLQGPGPAANLLVAPRP